jgi:16S rRNA (guanine527-N7)-methyltransferase
LDRRREPLPTRVQDTRPLPAAYDVAVARGLAVLGIALPPAALAAIDGHVRLLLAWTAVINLTAIRKPAAVALGHVVDSLSALPLIEERAPGRVLDLGSGGGFPGFPLAAALGGSGSATDVALLEPIGKKARFLETVAEATGLADRVAVMPGRAEELAREPAGRGAWDLVTARAVASTADLVELAFPLLAPGGALVAWKRRDLTAELNAAARAVDALGGGSLDVIDVDVPELAAHRLVVAARSVGGHVPDRYPRDPGQRRRRPW